MDILKTSHKLAPSQLDWCGRSKPPAKQEAALGRRPSKVTVNDALRKGSYGESEPAGACATFAYGEGGVRRRLTIS
jgi:hypothetical protein